MNGEGAQPPSAPGRTRGRTSARRAARVSLPLVALAVVLLLWQGGVFNRLFNLQDYTVPRPSEIAATLHGNWSSIWAAQWTTLSEAVIGYVLGAAAGFGAAVAVTMTGIGRRLVPGLAGAVNALPIVALAPIAIVVLGYGASSKIAVVTLLAGAVMALNACKGLTSVGADPLNLMYSYAASRRQILTKVRVMHALPYVFTALKYNVTIALVGAVIAEFFGAYGGIGPEMVQALSAFAMALAWSVMVVVGAVGILWYEAIVGLERLCMGWHSSYRQA
jgi:NitT/TauT family transport system permease protein